MKLDPEQETQRITSFIQDVLKKTNKSKVVIGLSEGIDSTTALFLLKKVLDPKDIIVANLAYNQTNTSKFDLITKITQIPKENIYKISIKESVDKIAESSGIDNFENNKVRVGNIMARVRMIFLFDLAKKYNGLVCGTENKSEDYLGYFTRFGDQASDFEPIIHLYKTQVYKLAKFLAVPKEIIDQAPTAGLWEGQTDQKELGFSYEEADQVLYMHFEENLSVEEIKNRGFENAEKIIKRVKENEFKHKTPYFLK